MVQVILDGNLKNSLNAVNNLMKKVLELEAFRNRMGAIKHGKK